MPRRAEPDYVSGVKGRYEIAVPVTHPPHCVCELCPKHRKTREDWERPFRIRVRRVSPHPSSRVESATYAQNLKREIEQQLADATRDAEEARRAKPFEVTFGQVCDLYREYQRKEGKRYDRAQYLIDNVEALLGRRRRAEDVGWKEYREVVAEVSQLAPQTQRHYANTLLAMMNHAVAERLIAGHGIGEVRRPKVTKSTRPVTWTKDELATLLGPAMDAFEREQAAIAAETAKKAYAGTRSIRTESVLPLRGLCLVAYFTLMRPKNNTALTWEEIRLHATEDRGQFELDNHKNVNKGIAARGPIAAQLARYLRAIRPADGKGFVHANPATGQPYVDIRKQWSRLVRIAEGMLGYKLEGRKGDFFTFRHTGASHLAEKTKNPVLIVKMMGDTKIDTVMKHYFDLDMDFMEEMVREWSLPEKSSDSFVTLM